MSAKITELTLLDVVTNDDYLVLARESTSQNYKLKANGLFASLLNIGHTSPVYLIDSISSTNAVNQKGLKSANNILTIANDVDGSDKNVLFTVNASNIDLSACNNSTAGFLTSVDLSSATGVTPVANGGTGVSSFPDKSVPVTQDSGASAISFKALNDSGILLIGGASGPEPAKLTAGTNIGIDNGDNSITINSTFTTATADINMAGFNLDMDSGWISGDGTDGGLGFNGEQIYVGSATNEFYNDSVNIESSISFFGGLAQNIRVLSSATTYPFKILGSTNTTSGGQGGAIEITAGAGSGSGNGGNILLTGGSSDSGSQGDITLSGDALTANSNSLNVFAINSGGTAQEVHLVVAGGESLFTKKVRVNADLEISSNSSQFIVPRSSAVQVNKFNDGVTTNTISGVITLKGEAFPAGTQNQFRVTNTHVSASSVILLTVEGVGSVDETDNSIILAQTADISSGYFDVVLHNIGSADTDLNSRKIHFFILNNNVVI